MVQIYWAGGEDVDFAPLIGTQLITQATIAGAGRPLFTRGGLQVANQTTWLTPSGGSPFNLTTFWFSAQLYNNSTGSQQQSSWVLLDFLDVNGLPRLQLRNTTGFTMQLVTVNAAGTATQLGSNFTPSQPSTGLIKLDVNINYGVSGSISIYYGGVLACSYTGNITTDSNTTLANFRLRTLAGSSGNFWSEIMISDTDTRSFSLQTLQPVANGNTHNFDTGTPAAANVNALALTDSILDGSSTAGQIDEYTIPALVTGAYSIIAVGVSARVQCGISGGPTHAELVVRSGTTDYLSSSISLVALFQDYQNWWTADPNTSAAWVTLPVNIGVKSLA